MGVVVVATFHPIPEHREELLAALEESIPLVHAQDDGCELYALHESRDAVVMIEKWASQEALAAHGSGPAFTDLSKKLAGKVTGQPELQILAAHPAGTPEQGAL